MGVKGLNKIIEKYAKEAFNPIHLSSYKYKKIAIDISLYMFKYKAIFGERWLVAFINLVICLRKNDIHCIFIYDSKAPPEKSAEKLKRAEQRDKLNSKIFELEDNLKTYYETNEITETLKETFVTLIQKEGDLKLKKLLRPSKKEDEHAFDISLIEKELNKLKSQAVSISDDDFKLTRELFTILGIPYILADGEAETLCSYLCIHGKVDAVLSEDTDVLAYGTPKFLSKLNTSEETCVEIDNDNLLSLLEMNLDEFKDLCIMCGTDYNSNIRGIGPDKSFKLIKEVKSIDNITKHDIAILNHIRVRELYKAPESIDFAVPYCDKPDYAKVSEFIFRNNINQNKLEQIKDAFTQKEIVFCD